MSSGVWNLKPQNNSYFVIENISKTKVLAKTENDYSVILEDFKENKTAQLWRKGEPNDKGYFTLQNSILGVLDIGLTAFPSSSLKLESKITHGVCKNWSEFLKRGVPN